MGTCPASDELVILAVTPQAGGGHRLRSTECGDQLVLRSPRDIYDAIGNFW
jgi:hypothetical protein